MVGQDTAGTVARGERGLGERVGEGEKNAKGARRLGGEQVWVEKGGVKGGTSTLPAPWVRGACDGWDGGEESRGLFSPWEKAWGESTIGGVRPPSYLPPRTIKVRTEVGEDGASVCGDWVVVRAAAGESRGLRRRGAPAGPVGRGTPAVPDGMRGGTTGKGRGERGRRGTPAVRAGIG